MGLPNPSRETKFLGANRDREKIFFPVQLTTRALFNHINPVAGGVDVDQSRQKLETYYRDY